MHCLYGGYNLHRFSDALGLVLLVFPHVANLQICGEFADMWRILDFLPHLSSFIISHGALARVGDYEMMPVCACVS